MSDALPRPGYIKLARKAFESDAWWLEPRIFSRWEAWVDVIQLAAFKAGRFATDGGVIELARGEFVASLRWLASRWQWTVKRVRYWLATGQNGARLRAQRETHAGIVYLIVNYDIYQSVNSLEGTPKGTDRGDAGAQQGHKIEAGKSSKAVTTLSPTADEQAVLEHYLAAHPTRRAGKKSIPTIRKALSLGYSAADLCAAIDGNAGDQWHREHNKLELSYVLRDEEKIDGFRDKALQPTAAIVDAFGCLTEYGERVTRPAHA